MNRLDGCANGHANGHAAAPARAAADRLPPHDLDAEESVLSAMILHPELIDDLTGALDPDDFYRDAHRIVCRALLDMRSEGRPVDGLELEAELERRGELARAGGRGFEIDLCQRHPLAFHVGSHAARVKGLAVKRAGIAACLASLSEGYDPTVSPEDFAAAMESRAFALAEGRGRRDAGPAAEAAAAFLAGLDRVRATGVVPGIRTGWADLDEILGGSDAGQLVVVAARPSIGKTAFALQWAMHVAENHRMPSLFVSLEMGREELAGRLLAVRSGVDSYRFRQPRFLSDECLRKLGVAQDELNGLPTIHIDDTPALSARDVAATARRLRSREGIGIVFVDYLQLVDPAGEGESRQDEIARITKRLKTLSRELGIPVVALSQLNRQVEQREDRRPRMADIRESGAIENDAHAVMLLHRPEFYDPNDSPFVAEVIVAKNRNGPTGTAKLRFAKSCTRFDDLSPIAEAPDF